MKRIKKRRRRLRINNPVGFSLFAILCLVLLAVLVLGIMAAIKYGPGACTAVTEYFKDANATASPTPTASPSPTPTTVPESEQPNTPVVGEDTTPSPDTSVTPAVTDGTPTPSTPDPNAPLYGITIALDPFRDSGSSYKAEAAYNLEFAQKLKSYLEQRGATIILTREDSDHSYSDTTRVKTINGNECSIAIRLMCNHLSSKGTVGCYIQSLSKNEDMARTIINAYVTSTGLETRKAEGFEAKSTTFLKKTDCPSVNIILGHWSNKAELEKLEDEAFQQLMIEGIYNGLIEYFKK